MAQHDVAVELGIADIDNYLDYNEVTGYGRPVIFSCGYEHKWMVADELVEGMGVSASNNYAILYWVV